MNHPKGTIIKGLQGEDLDLSEEWVKTWIVDGMTHMWSNMPNNIAGDMAFEWDLDGSERKKWQKYLDELIRLGTYGDLRLIKVAMQHLPELDIPQTNWNNKPKTSATFIVFDIAEKEKPLDD